MTSPNAPNLSHNTRKRAPSSHVPPVAMERRPLPPSPLTCPSASSTYITGLSRRERVDKILQGLYDQHRWSFKDFIRYMVTEEPTEPMSRQSRSATARAETLANAICKQTEVTKKLGDISIEFHTVGNSELVSRLQTELRQLERNRCI